MAHSISHESVIDRAAFEAYTQLRAIAKKYKVENELEVPQLVIVGETSTGKSMLVQNFLRFPCSFSQADVATRCPVAYRLVYNPTLPLGELRIIRPTGITASQLANYLQQLMKHIQEEYATTGGFRQEPEWIEIESAEYTDFEIIDIPGLVGGDKIAVNRQAVEKIAESFVRNPRFSIVLVKETTQVTDNSHGARVIHDICTKPNGIDTTLPPRHDYRQNMITVHTKFDSFMLNFTNGTAVNKNVAKQLQDFGPSFFTNMIFGGYSMTERSFDENVKYLRELPHQEQQEVDKWIEDINRKSGQPPDNYQPFDVQYRARIGIDVVRNQIQTLWLKSFRAALPKLKTTIDEQLEEARRKYDSEQECYKLLDPKSLQENYLQYLNDFRTTLCQYVGYKSEIDFIFPLERCGQTYEEIEADYSEWKRKKQVTWRAYLTANELKERFPEEHETLNLRLVGSRHFTRLHNIFSYMILHFKPREPTRDWIETAAAHLAANTSDYDDMEKAVRDVLRTLLRETFLLGSCWLTQMYSYILDMFRINVKRYLLSNEKYPLLRDHDQFLNAVDLEYHIVVRSMIHDAIRLIRYARNSISAYSHYDITARMLKLVFSIPKEIKHEKFNQPIDGVFVHNTINNTYMKATLADIFKSIPPEKLLEQIYGSESFLTNKRDPHTGSHHLNGRRAIQELYTASCGRLLEDIRSSFNTSVVMKIHNFDRIDTKWFKEKSSRCPLSLRISRMTEQQISEMSNMRLDEINEACHKSIEKIEALTDALTFIDAAIREMNDVQRLKGVQRRVQTEYINKESLRHGDYLRKKQEVVETHLRRQFHSQNSYTRSTGESNEIENDNMHDDEYKLMTIHNPTLANIFLSEIYDKHDREDLTFGFLDGDSLEQDKNYSHAHDHLSVDPNTMNYDNISVPSTFNSDRQYEMINNDGYVNVASGYGMQTSPRPTQTLSQPIYQASVPDGISMNDDANSMVKRNRIQLAKR
ncbi:unnamed protein product [Rotaria sordida]|uniref:Dynamin N-terminal domain-containing protein n=3 Tax=Rotaria sordida TaxID=392033 RepID=A0A814GDY1_9BILA|nr:unnamed protein product [Rotaria sordida]CAF1131254.1 unnamed protein product [Rotaria sordida]